jgi:putative aldouronate transport system permease protein
MKTEIVESEQLQGAKALKLNKRQRLWKDIKAAKYLYMLIVPVMIYILIFRYGPMYGIVIAFKDYKIGDGIWGSVWVGLKHFRRLFNSYDFYQILRNSLMLNVYSLVFQFPVPIILALLLNEVKNRFFKKTVQSILYLPHFLSWVILAGIVIQMTSPSTGIINMIIKSLGGEPIYFMSNKVWWLVIYVVSGIWKEAGWGTIIYLASISNVDAQLYEAAYIDGANKWKQTWHITLPAIKSTIVILLIMSMGSMISVGFEKIYMLSNDYVREVSEVFATYTYRLGIQNVQYSYTSAVGLFQSIVNFVLLAAANYVANRMGEHGIW